MDSDRDQQTVIKRMIHWAKGQPLVRAMLLTSSRAISSAPTDIFSDYDVILALRDIHPYYQDRTWLEHFGKVLALYRDPLEPENGFYKSGYVVQYEDGRKIDFTLWPVEVLQGIVAEPDLPPEFDAGYTVLYDKDHLTDSLKPSTYKAFIPAPPSQAEYMETIEAFFLESAYVAKFLWRDDLVAAKHILDYYMKQEHLLPMLVWHLEIEHQWSVKPGPCGRSLKKWLRNDLWMRLESTYTGSTIEVNWETLFQSIALFRIAAIEVGNCLGFTYPQELERRVLAYLKRVKNLTRNALSII